SRPWRSLWPHPVPRFLRGRSGSYRGWRRGWRSCRNRQSVHLIPRPPVEFASAGLRSPAAPLLEKERDPGGVAPIPDVPDPIRVHRSVPVAGLPSDDDPIEAGQVEGWEGAEQRLAGQESDGRARCSEMVGATNPAVVLDRRSEPDVRSAIPAIAALRSRASSPADGSRRSRSRLGHARTMCSPPSDPVALSVPGTNAEASRP